MIRHIISGLSFPFMLKERLIPNPPDPEKIKWRINPMTGRYPSWFHYQKNIVTEEVRADAQWWSKCLCFFIVTGWLAFILVWIF